MATVNNVEFNKWDEELIKITLTNRTDVNTINSTIFLRNAIKSVLDGINNDDYPEWFVESFDAIINLFLGILRSASITQPQTIQQSINNLRQVILLGIKNNSFPIYHTLPFLENYAKTHKIDNQLSNIESISNSVDKSIKKIEDDASLEINSLEEKFSIFKAEADKTLSLLNKQAGKIGVKDYAGIFEKQAFEHSNFFIDQENVDNRKFSVKCFGKAQRWLAFAVIAFALLIYSFTNLDNYFSLKDQYVFTPEVTVHIIGRFLFISLFIFIVSFSFKQFRVNMHLYTLNKHRANTLKSFEYLTRAPDQLAPESYNAILMEVAKAIYESGQTGYISSNENHSDIPSIIDMSKVITQPRN